MTTFSSRKPLSIVLADDQEEVRRALRRYLDCDGRFSILAEAKNGAEALRRVAMLQPDALILDLAMPEMDGLEALPKIKEASPATIVVILSSMIPYSSFGEQAIELGAAAVFDKYAPPSQIVERILETFLRTDPGAGTTRMLAQEEYPRTARSGTPVTSSPSSEGRMSM